jgi:hypothetical protein
MKITMKTTDFELKPGTKGVYIQTDTATQEIGTGELTNIIESCPFFRRLGGSETLERNYTCRGFMPVKLTSKSPCRTIKTVRQFIYE